MKNINTFIAFSNDKVKNSTKKMLNTMGIDVNFICSNGFELKKQLEYYNNGIIICGFKLNDANITEVIPDISERFNIVLIGSVTQLEMCENERILKLAVPLSKQDFIYSIIMLANMNSEKVTYNIRNKDENKIIQYAKEILINRYNMTEEQAYRYIQKKSMNSGKKIVEIAKAIID